MSKPTKWLLFERDSGICRLCHQPTLPPDYPDPMHPLAPSIDHWLPQSKMGGKWAQGRWCVGLTNLAHRVCNSKRGNPYPDIDTIPWENLEGTPIERSLLRRMSQYWAMHGPLPPELTDFIEGGPPPQS